MSNTSPQAAHGNGDRDPATNLSAQLARDLERRSWIELPDGLQVRYHGQIRRMALPEDWVEGPSRSGDYGTSHFRCFYPPNAQEAKLCLFYRGMLISKEGGAAFRQVLDAGPHMLSPHEFEQIAETVVDKTNRNYFAPFKTQVEDLNDKLVLTVEGSYRQHGQSGHYIYVDADGTGRAVQEIYFQAPDSAFSRYIPDALRTLSSITWKQKPSPPAFGKS